MLARNWTGSTRTQHCGDGTMKEGSTMVADLSLGCSAEADMTAATACPRAVRKTYVEVD